MHNHFRSFVISSTLALLAFIPLFHPAPAAAQTSSGSEWVPIQEFYRRTSSNRIRTAIEKLPKEPVQILPIPVLFGVSPAQIVSNFGDPRSGGRSHEGQDILAAKGTPIVSPTQAVVVGVGVWTGAGNYVSTANPGGETFVYMHLDKPSDLDEGDVLAPGDLVGYVGNTGNAAGGPAHLHFEVRRQGGATDPAPRLRAEFSLTQKMDFLEEILEDASRSEKDALVDLMTRTYRNDLFRAQAAGIKLDSALTAKLGTAPASPLPGSTPLPAITLPEDLTLGSSGSGVVSLQSFLIAQNKGPAARALASAGATGNFGPITKSALMEYQASVGIVPADGYYGPLTRAFVQNAQVTPAVPATTPAAVSPTAPIASVGLVPQRDLTLGSTGADVVWLQTYLIALRSGPAASALAAAGATGYFGPATRNALAEYQAKAGIAPSSGYFGALTRARIAAAATVPS